MSMIGKTLGTFTLEAQIGKGGMGEVYKANDQKLGRDVAIKVLPEEFAKDADRVARFQREAKLLASLNHPNIAAIHGLEESDGTHFLVLELIKGDTLADRLKRGAIPVEEALKLALQIAEALEAAHEKGVIHRDLKPANIKVTPDGKVKVLDFGLAKAFAGDSEDINLSNSPTLSVAATQQGIILGTAAYMSPEQASGEPTDKRADIWAFGVVLYEMLTGRSLFEGNNVSQTLARVLEREPDFSALPPNLHFRIRLLLERCLKKEPKDRCSGISDARVDIQQVLADPSGIYAQTIPTAKSRKKLQLGLPWVAAIAVFCLIIAGILGWNLKTPEPPQVMRFDYELPVGQQFSSLLQQSLAISPDGRQIVYSTPEGLYMRSVDELDVKLVAGTKGDTQQPFFSPDGKWIGYFSPTDKQLKKIVVSGGAPVTLCSISAQYMEGASWCPDNTIVYGQYPGGIMRVSANGGTAENIVKTKSNAAFFPHLLPEGKSLLYTDGGSGVGQWSVVAQSLKSGEAKELFPGCAVGYLPTGHIVYGLFNNDNLYAIPFDPDTLQVKGGSVPIVEGVMYHGLQCAVSDSGTLVYVPGTSQSLSERTLVWVYRDGKEEQLSAHPDVYETLKISPDGTKVALTVDDSGNSDIWIWDTVRETMTRLTFDEAGDSDPLWTPDGKRVAFWSAREEPGIYWKAADGSGDAENLCSIPNRRIYPLSWGREGKILLFEETGSGTGNIGMLSIEEEDRAATLLLQEKHNEAYPQISPDGRWMAYHSDESGQMEVYVRSFPELKGRWQISNSGGMGPRWSPDGQELFYRGNDAIMAVPVETEPTFKPGKPEVLFPDIFAYYSGAHYPLWDIHADGKRFLLIKPVDSTGDDTATEAPRKINIVLNWFEELKQRVPTN